MNNYYYTLYYYSVYNNIRARMPFQPLSPPGRLNLELQDHGWLAEPPLPLAAGVVYLVHWL